MPDAVDGQIMLRPQYMTTYPEGDTSAGSRDDLVALLSKHGPGELIDGLPRLRVSDTQIFPELVGLCESVVTLGIGRECTYNFLSFALA